MTSHSRPVPGFTLIEIMIAMVLGLFLVGAVTTVFLTSSRNYSQNDRFMRMQENGRYAMKLLAQELSMVEFWGEISVPSNIGINANVVPAASCGLTYNAADSIRILNTAAAATAAAAFPCIATGEFAANTDVLAIKRSQGLRLQFSPGTNEDDAGALSANTIYLRTGPNTGELRLRQAGALTDGFSYWLFLPSIYYIRNHFMEDAAGNATDTIPTLYRKRLNTALQLETEAGGVAEGIENFRVEFGIDSDGDGVANSYTVAPAAFSQAVTARLFVLVRSRDKDRAHTDDKTYRLGQSVCYNAGATGGCAAFLSTDEPRKYYRQVFTTTVTLRNPANVARFAP